MEETIKWINERLDYIAENCDLKDSDNKRAFESLKFAKERLEEDEAVIDRIKNRIKKLEKEQSEEGEEYFDEYEYEIILLYEMLGNKVKGEKEE